MSYTKGKWITEASMSSSRFVRDILPSGECSVIAQVGGQGQSTDIANASLIAAAPDLLEELKETTSYLYLLLNRFKRLKEEYKTPDNPNGHGVCHIIEGLELRIKENEAAIAKTEGGE